MASALSTPALYSVQAAGALLVAAACWILHRRYGRPFLRDWTLSWCLLGLFGLAGVVSVAWTVRLPPDDPWRLLQSTISVASKYGQIAFLVAGALVLTGRRAWPSRHRVATLAALAAAGVAWSWMTASLDVAPRYLLRVSLAQATASVAFLWAAHVVWRGLAADRGLGRGWLATTLALYGAAEARYAVTGFILLTWPGAFADPAWLGLFDFFLHASMGTAVAALLLEEEASSREAGVQRQREQLDALAASERALQHAQRLEATGRLVGGVAHDFNNLLTAITGYGSLVRDRLPDGRERRELDLLLDAASRATDLTRQLLSFSRKPAGHPKPIDVGAVVSALEPLLHRLVGPAARLAVHVTPGLPSVHADRSEIEQVVVNLVVNARDAMPGGGTIAVDARLAGTADAERLPAGSTPHGYVAIAVSDTGAGITPDILPRIFEPFFTTKGDEQGTGLGLATVHRIVTDAGGQVHASSSPGDTVFTVYLPASSAAAAAAAPLAGTAPTPVAARRILVAEDEETVRALVVALLERDGHQVIAGTGGLDALSRLDDGPLPDLVLTDVVMPDISGPELVRRLRERAGPQRVIYMTGYANPNAADAAELRSAPVLRKPFTPAALSTLVARTLGTDPR